MRQSKTIRGDVWTQETDGLDSTLTVTRDGKVIARFVESYEWSSIAIGMKPRLKFGRGGRRQRKRRHHQL